MTETTDNPTPQDATETGPVEATPTDLVAPESQQPAETQSHATNDEPAATSDGPPASEVPTEEVLDTEVHIAQI